MRMERSGQQRPQSFKELVQRPSSVIIEHCESVFPKIASLFIATQEVEQHGSTLNF
jgi:hypothetical protein